MIIITCGVCGGGVDSTTVIYVSTGTSTTTMRPPTPVCTTCASGAFQPIVASNIAGNAL